MDFRTKLISELTQMDERDSKRPHHNRYAIGMYLEAAGFVVAAIEDGVAPEKAFAEAFNPTRGMHRVARNLGLRLDVQRGQWIQST